MLTGDQEVSTTTVIATKAATLFHVEVVVVHVVVTIKITIAKTTTKETLILVFHEVAGNNIKLKEAEATRIALINHKTRFLSLTFLQITMKKI